MPANTPFRTACAIRGARLALTAGETYEAPSASQDRLVMVLEGDISLLRAGAKKPLGLSAGDVLTLPAKTSFTMTAGQTAALLFLL